MERKRIIVRSRGLRGVNTYEFYNASYVINQGTRGILFAGFQRDTHDQRFRETKYLPFDLIMEITIEDDDGGIVFVRDPRFLQMADDIAQVYQPEDCHVE